MNQITLQSPVKLKNNNVEDSSEKTKKKNQTLNTDMILYSNNHDYSNVDTGLFFHKEIIININIYVCLRTCKGPYL